MNVLRAQTTATKMPHAQILKAPSTAPVTPVSQEMEQSAQVSVINSLGMIVLCLM